MNDVKTETPLPAGMMMDMATWQGGKNAKPAYTPDEANRIADMLRQIGGGLDVRAEPIGDTMYGPRGYKVLIRANNRATGNHNLFSVPLEPGIDMKRAKQLVKEAKDKFAGRDTAAKQRAATERQVNQE